MGQIDTHHRMLGCPIISSHGASVRRLQLLADGVRVQRLRGVPGVRKDDDMVLRVSANPGGPRSSAGHGAGADGALGAKPHTKTRDCRRSYNCVFFGHHRNLLAVLGGALHAPLRLPLGSSAGVP